MRETAAKKNPLRNFFSARFSRIVKDPLEAKTGIHRRRKDTVQTKKPKTAEQPPQPPQQPRQQLTHSNQTYNKTQNKGIDVIRLVTSCESVTRSSGGFYV